MKLFDRLENIKEGIHAFISKIFHGASNEIQKLMPIATGVVQQFKTFDDKSGDILAAMIGGLAPAIQAQVKTALPKVLAYMNLVSEIKDGMTEEEINAVLSQLLTKVSAGDLTTREKALSELAALILQQLSDGKISFNEAIIDVKVFFDTVVNQK